MEFTKAELLKIHGAMIIAGNALSAQGVMHSQMFLSLHERIEQELLK